MKLFVKADKLVYTDLESLSKEQLIDEFIFSFKLFKS